MHPRLSNKILRPDFQGEFTASILAAAASPELISFAGGLPNPVSFPVEEMDKAAHKVLEHNGVMALQYSGTQGYQPLREWVAKRYETMGVSGVQADDINVSYHHHQRLAAGADDDGRVHARPRRQGDRRGPDLSGRTAVVPLL